MNRGDIVLAAFPHASGTPPKTRPVLVIQSDFYNQRITNVLVASITSNLARRNDPAHYFVDVTTADGQKTGLKQDSLISCLNIAVVPKSDLGGKIGELSAATMHKIGDCLKVALEIP